MNRTISLLLLSLFALLLCTTRSSSKPTSDEEAIRKLELEGAKHSGTSDADIAFAKSIFSETFVSVDPLGHVTELSPASMEKMALGMKKADPEVKVTNEIQDIKVRISGDTAVVTLSGTYNATGHKDPRYDVPNAKYMAANTWQKRYQATHACSPNSIPRCRSPAAKASPPRARNAGDHPKLSLHTAGGILLFRAPPHNWAAG